MEKKSRLRAGPYGFARPGDGPIDGINIPRRWSPLPDCVGPFLSLSPGSRLNDHDTKQVLQRIRGGDAEAEREVFDRFLLRLLGLARVHLSEKLAAKVDADDVVQSAFRSFFLRAREGQFVIDRAGDLWRLLAAITRRKLLRRAEHFRQQRRALDRDQPITAIDEEQFDRSDLAVQPTSEEAMALADEVEFMMRDLDDRSRTILELRLQGQAIPDIAGSVERSERTIRRFLSQFRVQLERRLDDLRAS